MNIAIDLTTHIFFISLVFYIVGRSSLTYFIYKYQISQKEFNQFVDGLAFPLTYFRKFIAINVSELDKLALPYAGVARLIATIILLILIVPAIAVKFRNSQGNDRIALIFLCLVYAAAFVASWRFGRELKYLKSGTNNES
jgi:hypothetical protein